MLNIRGIDHHVTVGETVVSILAEVSKAGDSANQITLAVHDDDTAADTATEASADTTAPSADTTAPSADTTAPSADTTAPSADTTAPSADTTAPAADKSPVLIVGTFDLTGPSPVPEENPDAVQAWVDYINAKGGLNGHPVEFEWVDVKGDAAGAQAATQELLAKSPILFLLDTPSTEAAQAETLAGAEVPVMGAGYNPAVWGGYIAAFGLACSTDEGAPVSCGIPNAFPVTTSFGAVVDEQALVRVARHALDRLGVPYWRSDANFVLAKFGDDTRRICEGLLQRGIYVRDRSKNHGCQGCVRITTGVVEHTERCIAAIEEVLCAAR